MAHKRSSSRLHAAGSVGTDDSGPLSSQLVASSSFVLPSYSTPDMNIANTSTSSSNFTFSHSNSLPSMSDMTSSSSRSSTSISSGSTSSLSSFSSSISANALYQAAQDVSQKFETIHPWKDNKPGSRSESNTGLLTSTADRDRPDSTPVNLRKMLHPHEVASSIRRSLPESSWDRLVLVVFLAYLTVLLRALAGYGGSPAQGCARITDIKAIVSKEEPLSLGIVPFDTTINSTILLHSIHKDLNESIVHVPVPLSPSHLLTEDLVVESSHSVNITPDKSHSSSPVQDNHLCSCNCAHEAPPVEYANLESDTLELQVEV